MRIVVSACLLGENCKYSGGNNENKAVLNFVKDHELIPVCPEVLGGLPVPRMPAEIVNGVVRCRDGRSVDDAFRSGAAKALTIALKEKAELAILQSRSPSCGVKFMMVLSVERLFREKVFLQSFFGKTASEP